MATRTTGADVCPTTRTFGTRDDEPDLAGFTATADPDQRGIRVGFLARYQLDELVQISGYAPEIAPWARAAGTDDHRRVLAVVRHLTR